jgi:hypothetical protein
LLERYQRGDHLEVWRALAMSGPVEGDDKDIALAVARSTMARVRNNAEMLAERLTALGWHALTGVMVGTTGQQPFPSQAEAEAIAGAPLPVALLAFWEVVGSLDFVWDYRRDTECPDLFGGPSILDLDPLHIGGADLAYEVDTWRDMISGGYLSSSGPFRLELAPDSYHKANISGGSAYSVVLPDSSADPLLAGDGFSLRFTGYLRLAFRFGGFPGLALVPDTHLISARVSALTKGMEPF